MGDAASGLRPCCSGSARRDAAWGGRGMASERRTWMVGAAVVGALLALPAHADSSKISADLREQLRGRSGEQRVIVTYAAGTPSAVKAPRRAGFVLNGIDAVSDRLTGAEIAALAADPS